MRIRFISKNPARSGGPSAPATIRARTWSSSTSPPPGSRAKATRSTRPPSRCADPSSTPTYALSRARRRCSGRTMPRCSPMPSAGHRLSARRCRFARARAKLDRSEKIRRGARHDRHLDSCAGRLRLVGGLRRSSRRVRPPLPSRDRRTRKRRALDGQLRDRRASGPYATSSCPFSRADRRAIS